MEKYICVTRGLVNDTIVVTGAGNFIRNTPEEVLAKAMEDFKECNNGKADIINLSYKFDEFECCNNGNIIKELIITYNKTDNLETEIKHEYMAYPIIMD